MSQRRLRPELPLCARRVGLIKTINITAVAELPLNVQFEGSETRAFNHQRSEMDVEKKTQLTRNP